ncbi:hypothetical protein J4423_01250 [Candidatus Pacearchaeota archaeon]|nr:hypothetical protein [Candidatus Pacearchaeota archaeon]
MTVRGKYDSHDVDEYIGSCFELENVYRNAVKGLVNLTGRRSISSDDVVERQRQIFYSLQEGLKSFESCVPSEVRRENHVVDLVEKVNELIESGQ